MRRREKREERRDRREKRGERRGREERKEEKGMTRVLSFLSGLARGISLSFHTDETCLHSDL